MCEDIVQVVIMEAKYLPTFPPWFQMIEQGSNRKASASRVYIAIHSVVLPNKCVYVSVIYVWIF